MWQLNNTRISCSAGALGIAGGAIDAAIGYANERTQFGKKIGSYQMIQAQIADMVAEHEAAQLLVYRAAWLKDQGLPNQQQTSMAKLFASEAAVHAASETMKIFGSYGYSHRVSGGAIPARCPVPAGRRRDKQHPEDHHRRHQPRRCGQPLIEPPRTLDRGERVGGIN